MSYFNTRQCPNTSPIALRRFHVSRSKCWNVMLIWMFSWLFQRDNGRRKRQCLKNKCQCNVRPNCFVPRKRNYGTRCTIRLIELHGRERKQHPQTHFHFFNYLLTIIYYYFPTTVLYSNLFRWNMSHSILHIDRWWHSNWRTNILLTRLGEFFTKRKTYFHYAVVFVQFKMEYLTI